MTSPAADRADRARPFTVLVVCTANQCRSPMAEYLLRAALVGAGIDARTTDEVAAVGEPAGGWVVGSAGTRTRGGRPMDPAALAVLAERGIDGAGFVGRGLTQQLISDADLILTATRDHRGQAAQLNPTALARLFTIKQFGYLAGAAAAAPVGPLDPRAIGSDLIARVRAARSQVPGRTAEDDLADPVGRPVDEFRRCAVELDTTIAAVMTRLSQR